jgi:hypothetical protein
MKERTEVLLCIAHYLFVMCVITNTGIFIVVHEPYTVMEVLPHRKHA